MNSILIIEDNYLMRFSLKMAIDETKKYVIDTAVDGAEALKFLTEKDYDLLLIDIHLPDINGIDLAAEILKNKSTQKILFITGLDYNDYIGKLINVQNNGFILKSIEADDLKFAIDYALRGGIFYGNQILKDFFELLKANVNKLQINKFNTGVLEQLTIREIQIAKYITEGLTSADIGKKLFLSKRTVDNHRYNILNKLNIKNSSELVAIVVSSINNK
jgi:DNA-binding NarL/FixJ family response regulator